MVTDTSVRAAEARHEILASGDAELIRRLYLLEAATPAGACMADGTPAPGDGAAWLGLVLGGLALTAPMQAAFAAVAEDLGIDMTGVDIAALAGLEAADPARFDALGLGDISDDLGAFFDV